MLSMYYLMQKSKKEKCKISANEYYQAIINKYDDYKRFHTKKVSQSICRVCLQEGCIPIFGTEDTAYIEETLLVLSNVEVSDSDDLPKLLCNVCYEFIKGARLFRKIARESNEILKMPVIDKTVEDEHDNNDHDFSVLTGYDRKSPETWEAGEEKRVKKKKKRDKTKVICDVCNKVVSRSYFKEHMTMHDPDHKKYICDVCGKAFRLRCAYHNHSLRHNNEFPFKCQLCPYKGRYSELLKTHMKTHTGDYRYMCTECPARFLFKSNLNSHALKHKEPQLKCDACNRAFHTKLMLQRHYESDHLGIKNHVCNICGKAFGYRNAMMKHQRHVHKRKKLSFGRRPAYLDQHT